MGGLSWTAADEDRLRAKFGLVPDAKLARKLGRTVAALHVRAQRLGIRRSDNFLTASMVATVCGVWFTTVRRWITLGWLAAEKAPYKTGSQGQPWLITPTALEAFIKAHPAAFDVTRMPESYYRSVARQVQPRSLVPTVQRNWSARDDAYLLNHHKAKTYAEIGAFLRRTEDAVHARLQVLRGRGHMASYKSHWRGRHRDSRGQMVRWTEAEDALIRARWGQPRPEAENVGRWGRLWTARDLGTQLLRTPTAIGNRAARLGLTWPRAVEAEPEEVAA